MRTDRDFNWLCSAAVAQRVRRRRDEPDALAVAPLLVHPLQAGGRHAATAKLHADIARAIADGDEERAAKASDKLLDAIEKFARDTRQHRRDG